VNTESNKIAVFISHSQSDERFLGWPDQSPVFSIQSINPSRNVRLGAEQMLLDSYRGRFSGAAMPERFGSNTRSGLMDWQLAPSSPMQMQCGSGTLTAIKVVFWVHDAAETSPIDPYSSACPTFAVLPGYESDRFPFVRSAIPWGSPKVLAEPEANIQVIKELASPIVAENWDKEDDLRFDLLVEKEALGELSLEETKDLERLSNKRDRTVARVSDEDLSRERMRNRALTQLQDWLEENAPLFARGA
jgi:hypothetical protein